eukprot:564441-Karenia_brevis.AAC.1
MTFYKIWDAQGGARDPHALTKALICCVKCILMGEPMIDFYDMTYGIEFLYFKRQYKDIFTQTWTKSKEKYKDVVFKNQKALTDPTTE